jgi:hypothetical protein
MLACEKGDNSIVQMLLEAGSDVEAQMTVLILQFATCLICAVRLIIQ